MLPRPLLGLFTVLVLALAGCAHSPQAITPQVKLNTQIAAVGRGQPVGVRVVDGRSSPVLGTRGGLYPDSSYITVSDKAVLPRLQAEVEAGVRLLGFTPSQGVSVPQITFTLVELTYQSPKELYVTQANLKAVLRVDVQNSQRRYSGRYSASLNQRFGSAPNQATNTKLISEVLSDALNRAFKDPTLGELLAQ